MKEFKTSVQSNLEVKVLKDTRICAVRIIIIMYYYVLRA